MTKKEAVMLAARLVGTYLLLWALLDLTYLPARFFSLAHHSSILLAGEYLSQLDRIELMQALVRIATLLLLSLLFFRAGPAVQSLLLGTGAPQESVDKRN